MPDFPTQQELFRIGRDEALSRNPLISLDVIEREGTDANAFVAASAGVGDEVVGQLTTVEASLFLDSAKGQKLDRVVFDRYGLTRKPASLGRCVVQFTTTAPNPGNFTIPSGTKIETADNRQYITTISKTFPSLSTGPIEVPVRSVLAGLSQQVSANQLTNIASAIPGKPADLVVNNADASAGADDQEQDAQLRDRARKFFTTARKGTKAAIEQGALAVPGVRTANAIEVLDKFGRPAKESQLIISDSFTDQLVNANPTPPSYQAQSQLLAADVFSQLDDVRACGIFVDVVVASIVLQSVQLVLSFAAGVNEDDVAQQARAIVVDYMNSLAPGAAFVVNNAVDKLRVVDGLVITGTEIYSPPGDVIPAPLQALRTYLAICNVVS